MKRVRTLLLFVACIATCHPAASVSADWLSLPGPYSHDLASGQRVAQFAAPELPTAAVAAPLRTSGYTHFRSSLAFGQSADHYHRVQQWGEPVRPYGEWNFPYRPFSTPYPNWGAPFAGLNFNNAFNFGGGFPVGPGFGNVPPGFVPPGNMPPGNLPGAGFPNNPGWPGYPGAGYPGQGYPGQGWQQPNPAAGTDIFAPYPAGRGTPYPVAPYYDGYTPNYRD